MTARQVVAALKRDARKAGTQARGRRREAEGRLASALAEVAALHADDPSRFALRVLAMAGKALPRCRRVVDGDPLFETGLALASAVEMVVHLRECSGARHRAVEVALTEDWV